MAPRSDAPKYPPPSSSSQSPTQQAPTPTHHEPPWSGWIETTGDALIILEAARRGLIPRVTRRLVDSERKMITSGSVFVFDEEESGIRRWTDGLFWSASRILGNFLLYRETDKRGAGHKSSRSDAAAEEPPASASAASNASGEGSSTSKSITNNGGDVHSLSRPRAETSRLGIDRQRERSLVGSLTNDDKFKPGGMVKKTFSLTINGVPQHLISYYKVEDVEAGRLRPPSSYPELAALDISADFLDKVNFRNPPKLEVGWDGKPRYRGEADELETSPHALTAALSGSSGALPLLSEPTDVGATLGRSAKRYEPYGSPAKVKRRIKTSRSQPTSPASDEPGPFSPAHSSYAVEQMGFGGGHAPSAVTTHPYPGQIYTMAPQYTYQNMAPSFSAGHAAQTLPPMQIPPTYPASAPASAHEYSGMPTSAGGSSFTPPTNQPYEGSVGDTSPTHSAGYAHSPTAFYSPYQQQQQASRQSATMGGGQQWAQEGLQQPPSYVHSQTYASGQPQGSHPLAYQATSEKSEPSEYDSSGYNGLAPLLG
ncbi:unnamed protein product [Peniophora sp. CBMAI 1063]|nr:unnamed protein product [Peniophora sp. CBMAI 1063]